MVATMEILALQTQADLITTGDQKIIQAFLTMSHPVALVILDDDYMDLCDLIGTDPNYLGMALADSKHVAIYCSNEETRIDLQEIAHLMNFSTHLFV